LNKVTGISDGLKNKIYKQNHKTSPNGLYSPEIKNWIKFNSAKKVSRVQREK